MANGQKVFEPDFSSFSKQTIEKARTNSPVEFMTPEEQEVVFLMNLVRLEPQTFLEQIVKPYIEYHGIKRNYYVKSLFTDLNKAKSVDPYQIKKDLYSVAYNHMLDIGSHGLEGHNGSKGNSFTKRIKPLVKTYYGVSENIALGGNSPIEYVMLLLIDDGIKNLGHRIVILSKDFNCVGVSIGTHKTYNTACVMDFGLLN